VLYDIVHIDIVISPYHWRISMLLWMTTQMVGNNADDTCHRFNLKLRCSYRYPIDVGRPYKPGFDHVIALLAGVINARVRHCSATQRVRGR
jgi:hypothetical protein